MFKRNKKNHAQKSMSSKEATSSSVNEIAKKGRFIASSATRNSSGHDSIARFAEMKPALDSVPLAGETALNGHASIPDNEGSATDTCVVNDNENNAVVQNPVAGPPSFFATLHDPDVIERVRTTIKHSHVFKLPTRQTGSIGWRGADWKEKVWHGTVKVVDRNNLTAILLVDSTKGTIFAVCPIKDGINAVERCVDSSRYFVLRIENQAGRHMFIGLAFNERNDAFDFNTALQDAQKEREYERRGLAFSHDENSGVLGGGGSAGKDYSLKEGQKIKVNIPKKQQVLSLEGIDEGGDGTVGVHGTMAFANFQAEFQNEDYAAYSDRSSRTSQSGGSASNSNNSGDVGRVVSAADGRENKSQRVRKKQVGRMGGIGNGNLVLLKPSAKDTPARKHL